MSLTTTRKKPKDGEGVSLGTVDANPALKYSDLPSQGRQKRESRVREVTELILYKQKKINRHLIPLNTHITSCLTLPSEGSELSSFWGCICAVFHTHAGKKTLQENQTSEG